MSIIKKIFAAMILFLLAVLMQGCSFPDKLPQMNKLKEYNPEKFEYGKTTLEDAKKIISGLSEKNISNYEKNVIIITIPTASPNSFKQVRIGFKNEIFDWIEFKLTNTAPMRDFIKLYGNPTDINKTYNENLEYYNYNFFNISADKNSNRAETITYFSEAPAASEEIKKTVIHVKAENKKKFFEVFTNLEPGVTTESEFTASHGSLVPYSDNNTQTNSMYVIENELGNSAYFYEKAILKFENGLLTWINLIPKNMKINDFLKNKKNPYKFEAVNKDYDIYDFTKYILVVDKKTKIIKSIGIFNKDSEL